MKTLIITFLAPFFLFLFPAKSEAQKIKKEIPVSSFQEVDVKGVMNVFIKQGDQESLTAEYDESNSDVLIVDVKNGKLTLDTKFENRKSKRKTINVYLTVTDLNKLEFSGVGNLESQNALQFSNFELQVSGVGNLDLKIDCENLTASWTNVGNSSLRGSASTASFNSSCIGNIDAGAFQVDHMALNHSGTGNMDVHAVKTLSIKTSGIGNVSYRGNPEIKEMDISGIGKVKKV